VNLTEELFYAWLESISTMYKEAYFKANRILDLIIETVKPSSILYSIRICGYFDQPLQIRGHCQTSIGIV